VSWSLPFSEPIVLPNGSVLATLRDAYDHLNTFPRSDQDTEEWKAAAHCLVEAAEHGGAIAFARIGTLRAMRRQADRNPMLELIHLTMREVQQLKTDHTDPISRDREGLPSSPEVMKVIVAIVSSPAVPVELSDPTSMRRERAGSIKSADDKSLIASDTLQLAITKAVQKAEPAFVDVIVQRITPKSHFDTNWALRGVKFGKADREKANRAVTTVVEHMQHEFRLPDD
jgi:hypothetical protein